MLATSGSVLVAIDTLAGIGAINAAARDVHGAAGAGQADLGGEDIDGVHQHAPLGSCAIDTPSKDATFFWTSMMMLLAI